MLDGFSLKPLVENPAAGMWDGPGFVISSIEGNRPPEKGAQALVEDQHFTLRSSEWRYVIYNTGEEELYDLRTDPEEWENIASNPEHAVRKELLKQQLKQAVGF